MCVFQYLYMSELWGRVLHGMPDGIVTTAHFRLFTCHFLLSQLTARHNAVGRLAGVPIVGGVEM